jgi:hypothetical protein
LRTARSLHMVLRTIGSYGPCLTFGQASFSLMRADLPLRWRR